MEAIGPGFNSDVDDRTRLQAVISFGAGLNVEFLDGINRQVGGGGPFDAFFIDYRRAVIGVVVVHSIYNKVVVLRTVSVSVDGEKSSARTALNARLQHHKILEIAAQERKLGDGLIGKRAA